MPRRTFGTNPDAALAYTGGHTFQNKGGYVMEYCPDHPSCNRRGHVPQHRLVMEKHLGRFLNGQEVVHHINRDRTDNRLENLELFADHVTHMMVAHKDETKRYNPETIDAVRRAAADGEQTVKATARRLKMSHQTVYAICKVHQIEWISDHNAGMQGRHSRPYVLSVLQEHRRADAVKILGMSVGSLWRHYPEEMNKTARKKSLKDGGQQGGIAPNLRQ